MPVSITEALKKKLDSDPAVVHELIEAWLTLAKRPDMPAIRELLDRIDGRVPESRRVSGEIIFRVVHSDQLEYIDSPGVKELESASEEGEDGEERAD